METIDNINSKIEFEIMIYENKKEEINKIIETIRNKLEIDKKESIKNKEYIEYEESYNENLKIFNIIKYLMSVYIISYILDNYGIYMLETIISLLKIGLIYYLGFIGIIGIMVFISYLIYRIDN